MGAVIRPGAYADVVLFDPAAVVDTGSYGDPQRYPDGIVAVWVNGVRTVDRSGHPGASAGLALRREARSRSAGDGPGRGDTVRP